MSTTTPASDTATTPLRRYMGPALGAGLVVLIACLPLLNISVPGLLPTPTYQPGAMAVMSLAMVFAALALSYNMLLGTAGMLSFGHALYFGAGAYGLGIILANTGLPLILAVVLSLIGGLAIAAVTGGIAMRVSGIPFAMVTLAFAQAGSVLVRRNSGVTGGEEGLSLTTDNVPSFLIGVVNTRNMYWITLAVLVVVYLVALWIDRSRLGHLARATRENELRVQVLGLQPNRAKLAIFVIAALCASLAGVTYMLLQSGTVPRAVSADLTITILVMVVLGGVGFRWGAIIGGVLYTILDQRLTFLAGSEAIASLPAVLRIPLSEPLFILGVLFILVVMFLPGGIAGTVDSLIRRRRLRAGRRADGAGTVSGGTEGLTALEADVAEGERPAETRPS